MCLQLFRFGISACFADGKTVMNQRRVEKTAFEDQSEENSVWIIKWMTLLGIFCKISCTPTVTSCYQVHADAHISAALLSNYRYNWCRKIDAVNCVLHWIVLTLTTLHTRNIWLRHNHKMSTSYHKNGLVSRLVSSYQSVGRLFIFYVLCSKNILMKLVVYQQPTWPCLKMEFVVRTISLSCELFSLSKAAFLHVGPAQLCTENGVSICMCSAVEVVWLAQNIRHSSTRVWLHLQ